jgi:hypothetical protein
MEGEEGLRLLLRFGSGYVGLGQDSEQKEFERKLR